MKIGDQGYCEAIDRELEKLEHGIQRLKRLGLERLLTEDEFAALERYMRVLIDAAIGIVKRGTTQLQGHVPARTKDAFSAFRSQGLDATQLDWIAAQLDSTA